MSRLAHFEPAAMVMATLEEEGFLDLKRCIKCGKKGYLRKGACVNAKCVRFPVLQERLSCIGRPPSLCHQFIRRASTCALVPSNLLL